MAALQAPPLEDQASTARSHARSESVDPCAPANLWLIYAFWHDLQLPTDATTEYTMLPWRPVIRMVSILALPPLAHCTGRGEGGRAMFL